MITIEPIQSKIHLEVLTPDQLAEIKTATLHVLAEVGVKFPSEKALKTFAEHGAQVDFESSIVRMSPEFVLDAITKAPRQYLLSGRAEGTDLHLGSGNSYFATDGCGHETVDFETGERRLSCKEDVAKMARVSDYLSSIAFFWPMVSAQDYGKLAPLHEMDAAFNNLTKHVQTETVMGEPMARYAVEMATVIAGDMQTLREQPPLSSLVCTIAPLGQDKEGIEGAMVFAAAGIPVGFMGMPNMGSTAPAVPGGALVVGNAEAVSAMVLMQLVSPGAPVFQALLVSGMNPQSADYIVSSPEKYLCNAAAVQMAHDWGVPSLAGTFGVDAPEPDTWQLGRDSVYTALMSALSGTDITIGLGMLKASTLLVPEQIIFDDEIYHTNRILGQGLDTTPKGLGLDVIAAVGSDEHYLAQKHTRKHLRQRWIPKLTHPLPSMDASPLPDIRQRARAEFDRILSEHQPEPLSSNQQKELNKILQAAEKELGT
ncbi:MAG: trimethylamine methyltransferase family protein [Anaerolineales bacterium]|nr:trimethylamine methyltransferase family protein [Chloroflexota bacterium]MBL6980042.1 trimethylamine methyltransferase family protein [Anaerolineales bacterium]